MYKSITPYQEFKFEKIAFLFAVLSLFGCHSGGDRGGKPIKTLYKAICKDDTAKLNIQVDGNAYEGQLEINYHGQYKDSGAVYGIIKKDTLKGTYNFQHYGMDRWEKIPIALLKKGSKLILGVGEMEIYMNMTYFKKTVPIDYQNVKFKFEKAH